MVKFKDAYVSGWGLGHYSCNTNDFGPNPHTMCKFPFVHNEQVHEKCTTLPTPASDNPVCKQLFKWAKKKKAWKKIIEKDMSEDTSFQG